MSQGASEQGPNGAAKARTAGHRLREWGAAFARGDRIVVPILAGAAALRLCDLGRRSLWYDEAWAALGCLDGPFDVAHVGPTPLVFAALVRGSVAVFGRTEVAVRLPAALFSLGAVFLGYRLAREVGGRGGGMVAAALLGLLPIPVAYGKELKHYAAEVFLALAIANLTSCIRRAVTARRTASSVRGA